MMIRMSMMKGSTMSLPKQLAAKSKSFKEENDCAVKAVAIVCNATYEEAHATLKRLGRRDGRGTPMDVIMAAVKALGCHVTYNGKHDHRGVNCGRRTINSLRLPEGGKGRWLVLTRNHILAVVDGKVMDWTEGRRHQARLAWEVSL
jgi:hypothetical protein